MKSAVLKTSAIITGDQSLMAQYWTSDVIPGNTISVTLNTKNSVNSNLHWLCIISLKPSTGDSIIICLWIIVVSLVSPIVKNLE